ncbi:MAG: hypothetical protein ACYTFA_05440 [Planctomycetota bacterium]|jgi:hypothetical protein
MIMPVSVELPSRSLLHAHPDDLLRLKKGTGTSPGALLGGGIGHELGASPLFLGVAPRGTNRLQVEGRWRYDGTRQTVRAAAVA